MSSLSPFPTPVSEASRDLSLTCNLSSPWFLVYTKPKQEFKAEQNLVNQGFDVLLPNVLVEKVVRGKRVEREEPLFSRYLFIQLPDDCRAGVIRSTRGCIRLVQFGLAPPRPIPNAIIEELADGYNQIQPKIVSGPQKGDAVIIQQGPFRNLKAIFLEPDGDRRALLLLEMLGNKVTAVFENSNFTKSEA